MDLYYTRCELSGQHNYTDADGNLRLWRGHSNWYFSTGARTFSLCPHDWPDGDAIAMYRGIMKARRIRQRNFEQEPWKHENLPQA